MYPYAMTDPQPASTRPELAPGLTALPVRTQRVRPGPATRTRALVFGAVDTAPADARATLRECLSQWQLSHLEDDSAQILSELVANAVAASRQAALPDGTPAAITVSFAVIDDELWLRAWDPDPLPPPADYTPCTWDEHGRGLVIVKALSHRWGTTPATNGGKHVYATLRTSAQLPVPPQHEDAP
jgi:anti-sigma regulatory factor (Ser/Thr protein kinase)